MQTLKYQANWLIQVRSFIPNANSKIPNQPAYPGKVLFITCNTEVPEQSARLGKVSFLLLFYSTVAGVCRVAAVIRSPRTSPLCRLYFISFGIIEPILVILKIEYRLSRR